MSKKADLNLEDLSSLSKNLMEVVHLRTSPVGIKLVEEDLEKLDLPLLRPLRDFRRRMTFCQAVALSRYYGWSIGLDINDLSCPGAMVIFGLAEMPEYFKDGSISAGLYTENKELGAKLDSHLPKIPVGKFKGIVTFSLSMPITVPDIVLIYGTPGQMMKIVAALVYKSGEPVHMDSIAKAGSCSGVAKSYLEGKPLLVLPGLGDRTLAWTMDDEMAAAIPTRYLKDLVEAAKVQDRSEVLTYPPRPFLFYEFKFKNIPVIGYYYDKFLKELRGERK